MARFGALRFRAASQRRVKSLLCAALVLGPQSLGHQPAVMSEARGECGCAPSAAVPTQTYRLDYQTVYDERLGDADAGAALHGPEAGVGDADPRGAVHGDEAGLGDRHRGPQL
jgi:hypothetical protein